MTTILILVGLLMVFEIAGLWILFVSYLISRIKENINNRRIEQWTPHLK